MELGRHSGKAKDSHLCYRHTDFQYIVSYILIILWSCKEPAPSKQSQTRKVSMSQNNQTTRTGQPLTGLWTVRDTLFTPSFRDIKKSKQVAESRHVGPPALYSEPSHRQSPQRFLNLPLSRIIQSLITQLLPAPILAPSISNEKGTTAGYVEITFPLLPSFSQRFIYMIAQDPALSRAGETDTSHICQDYHQAPPRRLRHPPIGITVVNCTVSSLAGSGAQSARRGAPCNFVFRLFIVIGRLYWFYKMLWNLKVTSLLHCPSETQDTRAAPRPPGTRTGCALRAQSGQAKAPSPVPGLGAPVTRKGLLRPGTRSQAQSPPTQRSRSEGPGRPARTGAIRSRLSNPYRCPEVGTAAFDQRIHGFWLRSRSGSRNKSKSVRALSSS